MQRLRPSLRPQKNHHHRSNNGFASPFHHAKLHFHKSHPTSALQQVAKENHNNEEDVKMLESGRKWWLVPSVMAHLGRPTKTLLFRQSMKEKPALHIRQQEDGSFSSAVTVQSWMPQAMDKEGDLERQHRVQENMPTDLVADEQDDEQESMMGLTFPRVEEVHCARDVFEHTPYFKMKNFNYEVIRIAFGMAGFKRINEEDYNVLWGRHLPSARYLELNPFQRVNHFPGSSQLGRKDYLHINIHKMMQKYGKKEIDFFPNCFLLPYDNDIFTREAAANPNKLFISKPFASSCGRGISVVRASDPSITERPHLVQEYIENPLLVNGFKFDLRLYVVVTSFDPLRVYLFNEGLVRFATQPYHPDRIHERLSHLTNYSLNKKSRDFVVNTDADTDDVGSKWSVGALKRYFRAHGIDDTKTWAGVDDIICKTLIGVEDKINSRVKMLRGKEKNPCYEFYGFDVMIDSDMKPWLIEVNMMPSLAVGSPLDKKIKSAAVTQMFHLLGIVPYDRSEGVHREEKRLLDFLPNWTSIPGVSSLSKQEKYMLQESEDELFRTGDYKRIFPPRDNPHKYDHLFAKKNHNNELLTNFAVDKQHTQDLNNLYRTLF